MRTDREDLSQQTEALHAAQYVLAAALSALSGEVAIAVRGMHAKRRPLVTPAMVPVHAAWRAVLNAEQAVHIAETDLAGAAGEDT